MSYVTGENVSGNFDVLQIEISFKSKQNHLPSNISATKCLTCHKLINKKFEVVCKLYKC